MKRVGLCVLLLLGSPGWLAADDAATADAAVCLAYAAVVNETPRLVVPAQPKTPEKPAVEPIDYRSAYALYRRDQRPMVVMVTAGWCPYCPAMKRELLRLQQAGELPGASLVIVDYDQDRAIARTVMGSRRTLPALSVYRYVDGTPKESRPAKANDVPQILSGNE